MKLFEYHWFHRTDSWAISTFADSREEADYMIKDEVKSNGYALKGKYGPDAVYVYPVKKGLLKKEGGEDNGKEKK